MTNPTIGVTTYRTKNQAGYAQHAVSQAYVESLITAGACPVLIPLGMPEEALDGLLHKLDGVLFTGGGDVHPERYQSHPHPLVSDVDEDRDRVEIHLLQRILPAEKPFLGICRGLQVINIALGGTLYEDIGEQHQGAIQHRYYPDWPREHLAHEVQVEVGSRLADILGASQVHVNSLHHQGIRLPAPALTACAHAPDGIIEGIELGDYPFGLGVQWHPENLGAHQPMRQLFSAFVKACATN